MRLLKGTALPCHGPSSLPLSQVYYYHPMSKIAKYAANLTYSGSNTILRSKNL